MSRVAFGQSKAGVRDANTTGSTPREEPARRFEIPAGTLEEALQFISAATNLQVSFTRPQLRSLASPGVSGWYTLEEALSLLLAGSGAAYRFTSPNSIAIEFATVTTTIEVTGTASELETSTPKYSAPLRDTPQTITTVDRAIIEQQGVATLRDTLRNVAGISLAAGEGGAQGDNLTIRGFTARNDLYIDGMRDFGSYYRDPFNTEEVQVLQGPSSVTFGRGSTGGVVNQSTKLPRVRPLIAADLQFGTDGTRRVAGDLDRRMPWAGDGAAFRLNLMAQEGGVAGRDIAENRRFGIAPSLSFGLGTPTRATLAYMHQTGSDIPDYGIPWLFNGAAPVNRRNYYGFADGNFLRTYADIGTAKVEHDLNSRVTVRNQFRYSNYARSAQITEARVPANVTPSTPLASILVTRNQITVNSVETFLDNQSDLVSRFRTGSVEHNLVSGIELARETSSPTRPTWTGVPVTSLLAPDPYQPFSGSATVTSRVSTVGKTVAAYVLDTIKLTPKWEVTGGFRWDRFDADYRQFVAPVAAYTRVDNMPAWRAAVVYKPVPAGSVYVAASTSFNPSAEALSLSASTANLPPEKNRNYEAGTKWDLNGGRLSLRSALFRTDKLNAREPDPTNPLLNVLAGAQRVDGAQLEIRGRLMSRWETLATYAYLNARVIQSNYYPAAVGARLANVPRNSIGIWNNFRLTGRLQAGLGVNMVSSRTASSTVPNDPVTGLLKALPGYWIFSGMAGYRLAEHIDLQANIYNIANRYYYDQLHPGHIVPGPGRSALIGLKFRF